MQKPSRRMSELIDTLLQQTRTNAIWWTKNGPNSYSYLAKAGSIALEGPDRNSPASLLPQGGLTIRAFDQAGSVVERFSETPEQLFGQPLPYPPLQELWTAVERQTSDGNPLLDSLRAEVASAH